MTDPTERALLPAGLRDILPPFAEREAHIVTCLMGQFAGHGYERVKPPLIEFDLLPAGAAHSFRVMDPLTQRMMVVRSDMTPQVARIATTRMAHQPRPLRLAYAGQVLRVQGTQLRAERQFGQVGVELIGAPEATAEAEILALCNDSLASIGLTDITVDLTMATLVPILLGEGLGNQQLRGALDHKDVSAVTASGGQMAKLLTGLIDAVGPVERAVPRLLALELPAAAAAERDKLVRFVGLIRGQLPHLKLTVDPVENRGFEYYTGIGFTIFCARSPGEIGRGGRYAAAGEPAVGATMFMDSLMDLLPDRSPPKRVYLPVGSDAFIAVRLRGEGYVTISGLALVADAGAEARRLRCHYVLAGDELREISNG